MTKKYIAPLSLIALCLAALYATLSDTDRARLFNAAQTKTDEIAAALASKPTEDVIETERNETEVETEVAVTNLELCTQLNGLAESIMKNRQAGIPMADMMSLAGDSDLAQQMTIDAYDYPRLSIKSNQDDYVRDFADEWMVNCYKAMGASS